MLRVVATATAQRAVAAPSAGAHRTKIATAAIRAANEKKKGLSKRKDEGSVRDIFAPFKEAITATSPATSGDAEAAERVAALREGEAERDARRAEYSRRRMAEHHRVNGQLSRQIVLREAAILALPPQLRAEATEPDFESYPVRTARTPRRKFGAKPRASLSPRPPLLVSTTGAAARLHRHAADRAVPGEAGGARRPRRRRIIRIRPNFRFALYTVVHPTNDPR